MKLFTKPQYAQLVKNHEATKAMLEASDSDGTTPDHKPVVKLFTPDGNSTWLITELDPENRIMFGLADLGFGTPEVGSISLDKLEAYRGKFGLAIERDRGFVPYQSLKAYTKEAQDNGYITA